MYRFTTGLVIVFLAIMASCMLTGCATTTPGLIGGGKTLSMPTVSAPPADAPISIVVKEPNPVFLGKYSCIVRSAPGSGREWANPVWYKLQKTVKGYLFYYNFSPARGDSLEGYFPAQLDGDKISFTAPSGRVIQFFTKNGSVYFVSPAAGRDFEMAASSE